MLAVFSGYSGTSIYKPICNEVLSIMTIFPALLIVEYVERNLDIMKPTYSEHILLVPWRCVISRFHFSL